jgi:bacterioferritin (cytochrome b1)
MGTLGKAILRMVAAIIVMVPVGLLLGLYGETTNEFRERHLSPDVKATVRLQQLRNELAEYRKRTDLLGGHELDSRISDTERRIRELEKQLGIR